MYEWIKCWCREGSAELRLTPPQDPSGWIEQEVLAAVRPDAPPLLAGEVEQRRRTSYPAIPDQMDALWKIVGALLDGTAPPADALAMRDAVAAVKAAAPKSPAGPWIR